MVLPDREKVKIFFIQVREDEMKEHEFDVVVENSGLEQHHFTAHDVIHEKPFSLQKLQEYDAVFIGGSGSYSVLYDEPFIPFLEDVVRYCKEKGIPFLGLCFGFQIAVQALGGEIITDPPSMEVGTYTMHRTKESDNDPIIGNLPYTFHAGCGRKDRAVTLPEGMVNYVSSERCPYHYITYPGTRFFCVQFHPELWKREDNLIRIRHYREKYSMTKEEFEEQIKRFKDAPETRFIIKNFIDNVVVGGRKSEAKN